MKNLILTAALAMSTCAVVTAQIPNGDFEQWTNMGSYSNPDSWGNMNDMTTAFSVYTCTKGTPGAHGAGYLKLVSKDIPGIGVMPAIAVSGTIDMLSDEISGFAYNKRPTSFTGSWQYMAGGSDMGFVSVELTRWDSETQMQILVATAYKQLIGMAMNWTVFNIPFTYHDEGNPDTCLIILSASGDEPAENDYLYVDNVSFVGGTTGVKEEQVSAAIKVFPNPVTDKLEMVASEIRGNNIEVAIFDLLGRKVVSITDFDQANISIDVSHLPRGSYFVKMSSSDQLITTKFVKN